MAGAGFEAGLGAVGELAFGAPELKIHRYIDLLDTAQGEQAQALRDLAKRGAGAVDAYGNAITAATPQINALNQDSISRLGSLADQYAGFDPTSTYERIRGGNISSLADQFVNLAALGQEGDKVALAARGYGGRGPSSYESILRSDRISRNIAPVLNTIFGNLGADTTNLNNNRLANLASIAPTLQYRNSLPDAAAARALLPYQAESAMLRDRIGAGGALAEASKANVAGYSQEQNKWAKFFQGVGRSMDQGFDAYMSLYGGGMVGGMGGGGMPGGGGGGLPAGTVFAQNPAAAAQSANMNAAIAQFPSYSSYGPYAGGYQMGPPSRSYGGTFAPDVYYGGY